MNVCIFDDETMAIDFLTHQLKKIDDIHIRFTSTTPNVDSYLTDLKDIDVAFLDIEMPDIDGLALAEQLTQHCPHLHIVFVSAHRGYAIEAFELSALDYLLKPVKLDRLEKTIQRITKQLTAKQATTIEINKHLHISMLGAFKIKINHKCITHNIQWRTNKSKELFLFLLHHSGKYLSKSKIVETLWPDIDPEKGFANLYVNIYNLRKSLKELQSFISITNIEDGYLLQLSHTKIDKDLWYNYFKISRKIDNSTLDTYIWYLNLYKGAYLEEFDYIWAESERFEAEEIWLQNVKSLANYYHKQNDMKQATRWYSMIIKRHPDDEHAAFELMKIYADLNYRMLVEHQYKELLTHLNDLDVSIDPDITFWFNGWKKIQKSIRR